MKKVNPAMQIALAHSHVMFRNGLKSLIEKTGQYKISIEAKDGHDLFTQLAQTKSSKPTLCIIELAMAPMNGYETVIALQNRWPELKILVLSEFDNGILIEKIINAGASGYLGREINAQGLYEAIAQVGEKGHYYTEAVNMILLQSRKGTLVKLTAKEIRFLCLCHSDLGHKEMAQKLGVEVRTLDNYRDSLCRKLEQHGRPGLAQFAVNSGLIYLSTEYLMITDIILPLEIA